MKILKVYNNNVVSSLDPGKKETVVMGRGIAFQKRAGEEIDKEKIEKIFTLSDKSLLPRLESIIREIPSEYFEITDKIVNYAKTELNLHLNENIYITLTDHISFAVSRIKQGLILSSPMAWDIKCFYSDEYKVGLKALQIISDYLHIELPEDEAAFITLHIVDASLNSNPDKHFNAAKYISEMLTIIKEHFNIQLDESSTAYYRLITHLKLFLQRLMLSEETPSIDDFLFKRYRRYYPETYECIKKIDKYVQQKLGKKITDEEKGYLMVHIRCVTERQACPSEKKRRS